LTLKNQDCSAQEAEQYSSFLQEGPFCWPLKWRVACAAACLLLLLLLSLLLSAAVAAACLAAAVALLPAAVVSSVQRVRHRLCAYELQRVISEKQFDLHLYF
jgi:Flp pilus assembly protein TadB